MTALGRLSLAIAIRGATPALAGAGRSRRVVVAAGDRSRTSVERYTTRRVLIDEVDPYPAERRESGGAR